MSMQIDIRGRTRNTYLPITKSLLPVFEAIVNSIHAIEEASISNGQIDVFIERDRDQGILISEYTESWPIKNFVIVDNGIGFNEENFKSFQTSDTTYKASKGSKGIGRFLWLKAFKSVLISSIFSENEDLYKRNFDFSLTEEGITNHLLEKTNEKQRKTSISLLHFEDKYRSSAPRKTETIARHIVEHCLVYFLSANSPTINILDEDTKINLNDFFTENIEPLSQTINFKIKSSEFQITGLRLYSGDESTHKVHYCAQNREVINENLVKDIPDLTKKIKDEKGNLFTYLAYVSGKYLDERVNSERTSFNIIDDSTIDFPEEITLSDLKKETLAKVKDHLNPFLFNIREEKNQEIERYVTTKAPQYRPILKHNQESLDEIPGDLAEEKLDIELYKIYSKTVLSLKEKSNELLTTNIDNFEQYPEYTKNYNQFIEQLNDFGKSTLAQYIVHRKTILDLLSNNLKRGENNRYKLERDVHEIIFPLKRTSDDVDFERQNLWIIDERLSYHKYLASDKSFKHLDTLSVDSDSRPDLIVFNHPFAFVEGDAPYSSIVIIEFKRPMRDSYTDDENPITQVYGYIKKVQAGEVTDKDGRIIPVPSSTPFYGYIICDMTKKIKEFAQDAGFLISPDHGGYFGFNRNYNAYIELISFDKLIADAKKRNNVLFEKLQIPIKH